MITVDNSVNIHVNSEPAQMSFFLTYRICFFLKVTCKITCDVWVYTISHIRKLQFRFAISEGSGQAM